MREIKFMPVQKNINYEMEGESLSGSFFYD